MITRILILYSAPDLRTYIYALILLSRFYLGELFQ